MHKYMNTKIAKRVVGFTIVELVVVISIIGILAGITAVSYIGWQESSIKSQLKSDLNGVASAMEDARTFNNAYPISTIPSTFKPSEKVTLVAFDNSGDNGKTYCIDAVSSRDASIHYYIDSESGNKGGQLGRCEDRVSSPNIPANLLASSPTSDSISLSWSSVVGASSYTVQIADNSAMVGASALVTQAGLTYISSGLSPGTKYYYRVTATISGVASGWSSVASNTTASSACAANFYGIPPDCYAYDALPVAASVEGYWTTAPDGYLLEDGSAVSRVKYADLFASIGTNFGSGNGITTFNLPDSRGRATVNQSSDVEFSIIGQKTGAKTESLSVGQLPSHSHTGTTSSGLDMSYRRVGLAGAGRAENHTLGWDGNGGYVDYNNANYPLSGHTHSFTSNNTGSGAAHNNIQPSIVKMFAIKYRPSTGSSSILPINTSIQGYWSSIPSGYLAEDGAAVSRTAYAGVYAAFGGSSSPYGQGNGSTTFNLPDSRGRAAVNLSSADAEFNNIGEKAGSKTEALTISQIPAHTHTGVTGYGNSMFYRLVQASGTSAACNHTTGWDGSNGYVEYTDSNYSLRDHTHSFTTNATGSGATHNNIQPSITKLSIIKYTEASVIADSNKSGTSIQGFWTTAPTGYLLEDGLAVSRALYANLFSVIGTTYGAGDGSTTFNLPDSRGRLVVNKSSVDTEFDAMGEKTGSKINILTLSEMAIHNHTGTTGTGNAMWYRTVNYAGTSSASNHTNGYSSASYVDYTDTNYPGRDHTHSFTTASNGGGGSHNNIQPTIVKMYAIKI